MAKRETDLRGYAKTPASHALLENATYEMYVLWDKKKRALLDEDRDGLEGAIVRSIETFIGLPEVAREMDFFCQALTAEEQRAMLLYTGILVAKDRQSAIAA